MKVSAEYAEEHFAELMVAADRGEEVEIARAEKPALKLVACSPPTSRQSGERVLGTLCGKLRAPSDEEWHAMDEELERLMNNAPLLSSGEV